MRYISSIIMIHIMIHILIHVMIHILIHIHIYYIYTINIFLGVLPGDQVRPRGFAQHRGRWRWPRGGEFVKFDDAPRKPLGKWENPMENMGKTLGYGEKSFFTGKCGKTYGKTYGKSLKMIECPSFCVRNHGQVIELWGCTWILQRT